jgi:hypothetical protein
MNFTLPAAILTGGQGLQVQPDGLQLIVRYVAEYRLVGHVFVTHYIVLLRVSSLFTVAK